MNPAHEQVVRLMLNMNAERKKDNEPLPKNVVKVVEAAETCLKRVMRRDGYEFRNEVLCALVAMASNGLEDTGSGIRWDGVKKGESLIVKIGKTEKNATFIKEKATDKGTAIEVNVEGEAKPRSIPVANVRLGSLEAVEG